MTQPGTSPSNGLSGRPPTRRGQFSLRWMLAYMLAVAVPFAVWKAFGGEIALGVGFVMLSGVPLALLRGPWLTSYVLAWLGTYGPFVAMASYMLLFVACQHCKKTSWAMVPCAPGVLLAELSRAWLGVPRLPEGVAVVVACVVSVLLVAAVTALLRVAGWWGRGICLLLLTLLSGLGALGLMALIRA